MDTPDITKAQVLALAQTIVGAAVALGAPISQTQSVALLTLVGAVSTLLIVADKAIREARNYRASITQHVVQTTVPDVAAATPAVPVSSEPAV